GIVVEGSSPTLQAAAGELQRGLLGLLGRPVARSGLKDGVIILSTRHIAGIADDGYVIRSTRLGGRHVTLIAANRDVGVLYGAFEFLRRIQTRQSIENLNVADSPKLPLRLLNHWDNLDRTVE